MAKGAAERPVRGAVELVDRPATSRVPPIYFDGRQTANPNPVTIAITGADGRAFSWHPA
jgi:hypothetical protein